jgi:biopolymer transport protein ExbB
MKRWRYRFEAAGWTAFMCLLFCAVLLLTVFAVAGEGAEGAYAASSEGGKTTVLELMKYGGNLMYPIYLCSVIALGLILERAIHLRHSRVIPPEFFAGLRDLMSSGTAERGRLDEFCEKHPSPLANIFRAGLRKWGRPSEEIEKEIENAGERELRQLKRNVRPLNTIASIATLLGLYGTVIGMIECFRVVSAHHEAMGRTELLASGIYKALITTAAGLTVAIPVLVLLSYFSSKIDRIVDEMDSLIVEFMDTASSSPQSPSPDAAGTRS